MQKTEKYLQSGEYRTMISGPFFKCELYNDAGDVVLSKWLEQPMHLDNSTAPGMVRELRFPVLH